MSAAEWVPVVAALTALAGAIAAIWSNRRKPAVDDATAQKIKAEIVKDQQDAQDRKALADAKRDRHIVALEEWAFREVRPKWRIAGIIIDEQNTLLVELAARAKIDYAPQHLPELLPMPEIDK